MPTTFRLIISGISGLVLASGLVLILTTPAQFEFKLDSLIHLTCETEEGSQIGTGFVVRCDALTVTILSAKHVVSGARSIVADGTALFNGHVVSEHPTLDLVILRFDRPPLSPPFRESSLSGLAVPYGSVIFLEGFANDTGPWLTSGYTSVPGHSSAPAHFGSSGGPLRLADGRVIGVLSRVYRHGFTLIPMLTLYEPLEFAADWLKENGIYVQE